MIRIAGRYTHCTERQRFPTGTAGSVKSKERYLKIQYPKRGRHVLPQKITCEKIPDVLFF